MRTWWRARSRRGRSRPGRKPLSCQELVELVTDYLEGALDSETLTRFEEHIDGCDGCTAYVEQIRTTVRIVGRLDEEHLPEPARSKLMETFRDWKRTEQ